VYRSKDGDCRESPATEAQAHGKRRPVLGLEIRETRHHKTELCARKARPARLAGSCVVDVLGASHAI
jgi:hypothetical protein